MQASKTKFYWDNMLDSTAGALSASSTGSGSINNIANWLEVNGWMESSAGTSTARTIVFDAGAGNTFNADYILIYGHNLNGSTIVLDASSDNFVGSTVAVDSFVAGTTAALLSEFTAPGLYRYWRVTFSCSTATQRYVNIMSLGTATELDYIRPSFDPYGQRIRADVNVTQGGYVAGIHEKYTEREISLNLSNETTSVYASVKTWFETHGPKQFAVAWDPTGSTGDVWLVRPDLKFNNPINMDKLRDITINLKGRKL